MSTRNYDASFLTQKKRAVALKSYNNTIKALNGNTIRKLQVSDQSQEVLAEVALTSAFSNPTDSCPCTQSVNAPNQVLR
jgi:hypothetical protein